MPTWLICIERKVTKQRCRHWSKAFKLNTKSVSYHGAGLSCEDYDQATDYLKQAAETAQTDPQYWYVYGLALEKSDVLAASKSLHKAYQFSRNPQHLYAQCEILARNCQQPGVPKAFEQCILSLSKSSAAGEQLTSWKLGWNKAPEWTWLWRLSFYGAYN